jgi:hypothetical protein
VGGVAILGEAGDRVAPEVLDTLGGGQQQVLQVAAEDLGVAVLAAAEGVAVHAGDAPPPRVDDRARTHVRDLDADWGDDLGRALAETVATDPGERFEAM